MKTSSGFTLIEVLIAMTVTLIIMGGAYMVFNSQQRTTTTQTNVSDLQQTLRAAMDFMARDIRMAGYDPKITRSFGISDIKFRSLTDTVSATGNSFIHFSWDKNSDGILDTDETMEYSLVDNATITPGTPDLYLRFPDNVSASRDVIGSNIIALGLAYAIDADNDGKLDQVAGNTMLAVDARNDNNWDSLDVATGATTPTGIPINTKDIRAVRIWMLAQSETPDPNFTDTSTYVVGPHVVIPNNNFHHRMLERTVLCRNLGLNL